MKVRRQVWFWVVVATVCGTPLATAQTPTRIMVRVVAHDAKIIGSGVGGARVLVRDPASGAVLAEGVQQGTTGDTKAIVQEPVSRGDPIYDSPGAAGFLASIVLERPTALEFVAEGPLGYEHALQRVSRTMLVLPGQHILGNGIVLTLNGFIVELLEPSEPAPMSGEVTVRARVTMMCGCTLEPYGLWDADRVSVSARISHGGRVLLETQLEYAGEPSVFRGTISLVSVPQGSELTVVASDPSRANFGVSTAEPIR